MYYVKHKQGTGQRVRMRITGVAVILTILLLFILLNTQIRRIAADSTQVYTQNAFSKAVSDALCHVLSEQSLDTVRVNTGADGQIVSVETDAAQLNRIKAEITITLLSELNNISSSPIEITLGTLTGIEAFAGRGPRLEMRLELRGGVSTEIISSLVETGINQSLHTIDCVVTADYFVILPGCRFSTKLSTTVPLAQSVIVGEVPDAYTYVIGDKSDTVSRIFDYAQLEP